MRRRIRHETTMGEKHLWAISLATTAAVLLASTVLVYVNHHRSRRTKDEAQQTQQQVEAPARRIVERSDEKSSAKKHTSHSLMFEGKAIITNDGDDDQGTQAATSGTRRIVPSPSTSSSPSGLSQTPEYAETPETETSVAQPFHNKNGIPTMLQIETDLETITDDDSESVATANWIHSPIRFNASIPMKKKMKSLGKKLHKITTKRRLAFIKKGLKPPPGPILMYCPESFV